jgi:hypothetical protein
MKVKLPILVGSALALLHCTADARASFIPWSYNWEPTTGPFLSSTTGAARLYTSDEPLGHAQGSSNVVITDLRTASTSPRNHPDVFTNVAFDVSLTIVDGLNGLHGTVSFSGVFNGAVSSGSSNLDFKLLSPKTVTLTFGHDLYTVSFGRYSPPGPPSATNTGSISSFVSVKDPTAHTPEPSTALLACLGGTFLGLASWRRWARGRRPIPATV